MASYAGIAAGICIVNSKPGVSEQWSIQSGRTNSHTYIIAHLFQFVKHFAKISKKIFSFKFYFVLWFALC